MKRSCTFALLSWLMACGASPLSAAETAASENGDGSNGSNGGPSGDPGDSGTCGSGLDLCDERCVDESSDPRHCGSCETPCELGELCEGASCVPGPDCSEEPCSGFTYCDLLTDLCLPGCIEDSQCAAFETCTYGSHSCDCGLGYHRCGGECAPDSSTEQCGAACVQCRAEAGGETACVADTCVFACDDGLIDCGEGQGCKACCSDDQCPNPAGGRSTCEAGSCAVSCDSPAQVTCGDVCTALSNDPDNCGACQNQCPAPSGGVAVCQSGQCVESCPGGLSPCNGACVDLTSDEDNCGACGDSCVTPVGGMVSCSASECVQACPGGEAPCDDQCVDLDEDPLHCGYCGHECQASDVGEHRCNWGSCSEDMYCYYQECVAWAGGNPYPACCEQGQHCCIGGGNSGTYCCD